MIVTARRREEDLQDVPVAVSAIQGRYLRKTSIQSLIQVPEVVPGVAFVDTSGTTHALVRGIGANSFGIGSDNGAAVYIDGVYLGSADSLLLDVPSIERVEILRGPQGVLFGQNAMAGAIQIVTADPSFTSEGTFAAGYGNYETGTLDLYATGAVSDALAADFSLHYGRQGNGFGVNFNTGNDVDKRYDSLVVRSKVLFEPSAKAKFVLAADYGYRSESMASHQPPGIENISFWERLFTFRFDPSPANDLPLFDRGGFYDINQTLDPKATSRSFGASLSAHVSLGSADLQSISAFRRSSFDSRFDIERVPEDVLRWNASFRLKQFSQEFRIVGDSGQLAYSAGLTYFHSSNAQDPARQTYGDNGLFMIIPPFPRAVAATRFIVRTEAYSAYAQGVYEIWPGTRLTLGGRYTHESKSTDGTRQLTGYIGETQVSLVPAGTPLYAADFDKTIGYGTFAYRIALDRKFGDDVMANASFSSGFKSGGFNQTNAVNAGYEPANLKAYEAGIKSELFGRRVRLNVAAYWLDYTKIQTNDLVQGSGTITNGSEARIKGIEAELLANPVQGLTIRGSIAYSHGRFTKYPAADYYHLVPDCDFSQPDSQRVCQASAKGNRLPGAPSFTGNLGVSYETGVGAGLVGFTGNLFHNSGWYGTSDNDPRTHQKSFQILNASIYFEPVANGLRFTVWGHNLLNQNYARSRGIGFLGATYLAAAPLTWGVTAEHTF